MVYSKIYSVKLYYFLMISHFLMVVNSAPLQRNSEAKILFYKFDNDGKGNYNFRYETSNGITREESGTLVDLGLPNEHISVQGYYSYINPEGIPINFNYTADENGYTILSSSTPPPPAPSAPAAAISQAILSSLLGK